MYMAISLQYNWLEGRWLFDKYNCIMLYKINIMLSAKCGALRVSDLRNLTLCA